MIECNYFLILSLKQRSNGAPTGELWTIRNAELKRKICFLMFLRAEKGHAACW